MGNYGGVEFVGLPLALRKDGIEIGKRARLLEAGVRQAEPHHSCLAGCNRKLVVCCCFGSGVFRIHGVLRAVHDVIVDAILHVRGAAAHAEQAFRVRLILCEEKFWLPLEDALAQLGMGDRDDGAGVVRRRLPQHGPGRRRRTGPRVAEPQRRQQVQRGRLGAAIAHGDLDQDVFRRGLGVLHEDVEVAVVLKYTRIHQFEFRVSFATALVFFRHLAVGKLSLRIFVQILHVRMRWRAIKVEVVFLHVLAVIAFVARQSKEPFFQNGIPLIPESHSEAHGLLAVADAG